MPATQVLVAGSLHYDVVVTAERLPALDETLPGRSADYLCGGKGGNQAIAAARHGAAVAMAGRVGDDAFGAALLANLDEAGVERSGVAAAQGQRSGMSVAIVTDGGDYGAVIVSGANLAIEPEAVAIPEGLRVLLLQNEIPEAVNAAVAARARAAGATVILNAAPARPFESDLRAQADLLVVNRSEAATLGGGGVESVADARATARDLAADVGAVIVTLGAEGVVLAGPSDEPRHLPAPAVAVHSTHGAGDSFVGALAARLALGDGLEAALPYAQAAAALHVSRKPEQRRAITPAMTRSFLEGAHRPTGSGQGPD